MIEFHLDPHSGVAPYLQIVQQVRRALLLGLLAEGDRLPTVKQVVAKIAINPNTVLKAYRDLERQGLVAPRPGLGTFVTKTLAPGPPPEHEPLRRELHAWLERARTAGLTPADVEALFHTVFHDFRDFTEEAEEEP
ncbi:GntR family transcriptional regulator [Catenulispora sp. GAS73]|uniref:GntR family transcriptional regulator n=1 Tax=Catenulispora sp. GAS73 TaxID=3156269 RepID=UPI0035133CAF